MRLRRKRWRLALTILALVLIVLLVIWAWQSSHTAKSILASSPGYYQIDHYVDGDTIDVKMNGHIESVRFIGIDTPETHKPGTPVQCFGPEASAHTQSVIAASGGKVRLVSDSLSTDRDKYDRLLRYVYLPDGTDLNALNVSEGYAFYYPYFPFSKSVEFKNDEVAAQKAKLGLWSKCTPTPSDDGGYKMNETEANP